MTHSNLPLTDLKVRRSFGRHVALEFYRGDSWAEYLAFEPAGLQRFRSKIGSLERDFPEAFEAGKHSEFFLSAVLSFVGSLKRAFIPGDAVADILMEVYTMATNNGSTDLTKMTGDDLTAHYNGLAKVLGKLEVKGFKSKGDAVKRIELLHTQVKLLTPAQTENKAKSQAEAARRLSGLEETKAKADKAGADIAKALGRTAPPPARTKLADVKAAAKKHDGATPAKTAKAKPVAKKASGDQKPRGLGIGAFCKGKILGGMSNEDVLAAVRKEFPSAATSAASVAWYRSALHSTGELS